MTYYNRSAPNLHLLYTYYLRPLYNRVSYECTLFIAWLGFAFGIFRIVSVVVALNQCRSTRLFHFNCWHVVNEPTGRQKCPFFTYM